MISKRRKLSWLIMAVFIISMVLPGFIQPTQAVEGISPVSITPKPFLTQVKVDTPLIVEFNQEISDYNQQLINITYQVYGSSEVYTYTGGLSIDFGTDYMHFTIIPTSNSNWSPNTSYHIQLLPGAVVFGTGENAVPNAEIETTFTTVDTIPPEISGSNMTTPQNGDNNVSLDTPISAAYTEAITAGPNIGNITMEELHDTNISVPISCSITNNILKISVVPPYALINSTTYTVTIPAGAVQDKVGNLQLNPRSFYFTTIDAATGGSGGSSGGSDFDGTISGTVTDENNQPLMEITVMALKAGDFENWNNVETGEDGTYSIAVPPGIDYYVIAYPSNFEQQPYARTFYPGPSGEASVIMENSTTVMPQPNVTDVNFVLKPGGSISGRIADQNENPLANITVKCQQQTDDNSGWYDWTTTDESGNYILTGLPFGTYTITAPTDINKSYEDIFWKETQLNQSAAINLEARNIAVSSLLLSPIDHPVVTDIWPKWIATGTTEGWISLNGAGFNTLGDNPVLKITIKGTDNTDVDVAESNEINFDAGGTWLSAKVHSIDATGITQAEIYNGSLLLTDNNNIITEFACDNWIGITSQPLIYGDIEPWAISSSKDSATLKLYGANLNSLGTNQIQVYMANKENPQQIYFGTAQAVENNDGSQYLEVIFDFTGLEPKPTPGSYFIAANNPPVTIHGMVDEVDVKDTSAAVEVVNFPAVTNVILQAENKLLVEGVNFNQFANMGVVAGVISDPDNPAASPYIQPVTRISDTELQVALPANIITNKSYIFDLYDNAGTSSAQWIPQSWWFYLPGTSTPSMPLTFTDQDIDIDHVYFDGNNISFEIELAQLSAIPTGQSVNLNVISGVWKDGNNFVSTNPSLKNVTAVAQPGKLIVNGQVNNPNNNTLPTGCLGIDVIIPEPYASQMGVSNIGPFPIIDSTGKEAIVGIQIQLPEGVVSDPVFTAIPNLASVENMKFTQTGLGSIQFTSPIDLYNNFQQAKNLSQGINVEFDTNQQKYYVAVDTGIMTFLADKPATITLYNVPFTSTDNLVISTNVPNGAYSNVVLDTVNHVLTFEVNHFSEYTIYELPADAVINPTSITYDRSTVSLGDLQAEITWNQASAITKVEFSCPDMQIPVTPLSQSYWAVQGNNLIIKKEFFLTLQEHNTYTFKLTFNTGNPATMSVNVANNPPGPITLTPNQFVAGNPIGFNLNLSTMYFSTASPWAVIKDVATPPNQVLPAKAFDPGYDNNRHVDWGTSTITTPGQYQLLIYDGDPMLNNLKATGYFDVVPYQAPNTTPTASNVTITGTAAVGQVLTARYEYADADNDEEGATKFQWYTSDTPTSGNYTLIGNATASTYTITAAELGKYIFVWVTPVALTGVLQGTVAVSSPTDQVQNASTSLTGTLEVLPAGEGYEFHLRDASDTSAEHYYGKVYQGESVYTGASGEVNVDFVRAVLGTGYEYVSVPIITEKFTVGSYTMKIFSDTAMTNELGNIGFTIIPMVHITNPGLHSTSNSANINITGYISNWNAITLTSLNLDLNGDVQDISGAAYLNTTTGEFTVPVTLQSGNNRFEVTSQYTSTQTSSTGHSIWGETTYTPPAIRDFSIGNVQLFNGLGDPITSVGAQGGYRIKAQIINNTAAAENALVIIQVRNGAGATATGGGTVLGSGGVETAIPTTGSNISCTFTLPSGLSGTAYVDVFVWDGWTNQVPLAAPHQTLTFNIIE